MGMLGYTVLHCSECLPVRLLPLVTSLATLDGTRFLQHLETKVFEAGHLYFCSTHGQGHLR